MKKHLLSIALIMIGVILGYSQSPNGFNYQTVVRDGSGVLQANTSVTFEVSIISGSITNSPVFTETHIQTTNQFGIANFSIGSGTPTLGTFSSIDWSTGDFFINTQVDLGSGLQDMGTNQLLSVPFALHANTVTNDNVDDADNNPLNEIQTLSFANDSLEISNGNKIELPTGGKTYLILTGDITDAQASAKIAAEVGPNTQIVLIQNTTTLTSVSLPNFSELVSLKIENNDLLASVEFPDLARTFGDIEILNNPQLLTVSFPLLEEISSSGNGLNISDNYSLTSLSFPLLQRSKIQVTANALGAVSFPSLQTALTVNVSNNALSSLDLSALVNCSNMTFDGNYNMTSLDLSSITSIDYLQVLNNSVLSDFTATNLTTLGRFSAIYNNSAITSIDFSNLTSIGLPFSVYNNALLQDILVPNLTTITTTGISDLVIHDNPQLTSLSSPISGDVTVSIHDNLAMTSLSLPNITVVGMNCDLNNNLFPSSQINALLAQLAAQPLFSGMVINMYQSVAAPPSGQGITDKATLSSNGNTVLTD